MCECWLDVHLYHTQERQGLFVFHEHERKELDFAGADRKRRAGDRHQLPADLLYELLDEDVGERLGGNSSVGHQAYAQSARRYLEWAQLLDRFRVRQYQLLDQRWKPGWRDRGHGSGAGNGSIDGDGIGRDGFAP